MCRDLLDIQRENYVADRRGTKPMDIIQERIECEQAIAFLEGAQNTARHVKDGSLKTLLANVDNHGLGDFEFREIVRGIFELMDRDLAKILEMK